MSVMLGLVLDSIVSGRSLVELNWLRNGGRDDERRGSCWPLKDGVVRPVDGREEAALVTGVIGNPLLFELIREVVY